MKYRILALLAMVLTFLAQVGSASACFVHGYQPEVPNSLKK
ncbi:cyclic lactone autoinducer peptide [Heliobacillus mobilis]|uniref:Cyclic lactone autoinducer peptide n=1 Tax=Heliobacterium mobile TaxID=28064 RepID=A0A6I3SI40_HELMO|nr:cyclic lactone autoinducer peptide [Heliobacterium mobile]MTV48357.1 cyclic lactone autoinducer peptide [Heliobacterium mobile]